MHVRSRCRIRRWTIRALAAVWLSGVLCPWAVASEAALEIGWDRLAPAGSAGVDDPFAGLGEDDLRALGAIARLDWLEQSGRSPAPDDPIVEEARAARERLAGKGIDADELLAQRSRIAAERRERAVADAAGIEGRLVRLPGYVLPIDGTEQGVTRFLLVPWAGACVHTPPPPPNQVVAVAVSEGVPYSGRFAPVWVEGVIRVDPRKHDLLLVDGAARLAVTYAIDEPRVAPYLSSESDVLARVEIPPEILAQLPRWERWQTRISMMFTRAMTAIRDREGPGPMLIGLLIAFLYGVAHTLGPGHGKAVVISYFVANGGRVARGIAMGSGIALCHVASAIVIVVATDLALRQATGQAASDYRLVRQLSYSAIVAIGGAMLWRAVRAARVSAAGCGGHEDEAKAIGCAACASLSEPRGAAGWLTLAVGAVPCTGALLVLLFGLANDVLWPAVLMVVAISLGMAVTLSSLGIGAILGRRMLDRRAGVGEGARLRLASTLRVVGAAAVLLVGLVLLFSSTGATG